MSFVCYYIDLSPHNIQRITEWIHAELDYHLLTPGYLNVCQNKQVILENQELKIIWAICNHVPRCPLFYKCGHLTCLPCLWEYKSEKFTFKLLITCPTCLQDCFMYEIYTYQIENIKRPESISMRMFNKAKYICSLQGCGQSFQLEQTNHHEIYESLHRNIQCPPPYCKFINKLETVINHFIKYPFHLIYCAECRALSFVFVLKHDCKVCQSQRTIPSDIKYYHKNQPLNHSHGDVLLGIHSFNESFKDYYHNWYDLFISDIHVLPSTTPLLSRGILQRQNEVRYNSAWHTLLPPTALLQRRILQCQNGVKDLSSSNSYNYNDWSLFLTVFYVLFFYLLLMYSYSFTYCSILLCEYYAL